MARPNGSVVLQSAFRSACPKRSPLKSSRIPIMKAHDVSFSLSTNISMTFRTKRVWAFFVSTSSMTEAAPSNLGMSRTLTKSLSASSPISSLSSHSRLRSFCVRSSAVASRDLFPSHNVKWRVVAKFAIQLPSPSPSRMGTMRDNLTSSCPEMAAKAAAVMATRRWSGGTPMIAEPASRRCTALSFILT